MKQKIFRSILLVILLILLILINMPFKCKNESIIFTLPSLPRPIAKEPIIITSAGQSTDTYIIHDISNQLMIRSFFMPQARDEDIKEADTIVFVVGYSSLGMKFQKISYEDEKKRIENLVKKAKDNNLAILAIALGGEQPCDNKNEELLRLICINSDYLIGLRKSGNENILNELSKGWDIPLTLVNKITDITEPFASAFR